MLVQFAFTRGRPFSATPPFRFSARPVVARCGLAPTRSGLASRAIPRGELPPVPAFTSSAELYKAAAPSLSTLQSRHAHWTSLLRPPPFGDDRPPTRTAQPPSAHRRRAAVKPPGDHGLRPQSDFLILLEGPTRRSIVMSGWLTVLSSGPSSLDKCCLRELGQIMNTNGKNASMGLHRLRWSLGDSGCVTSSAPGIDRSLAVLADCLKRAMDTPDWEECRVQDELRRAIPSRPGVKPVRISANVRQADLQTKRCDGRILDSTEGMALAELSLKVSEKGPETHQACGFLDETATDISWSLSAPSVGVVVEDVLQKQSDGQASLSMQPATSSDSELVATEQEVLELPKSRTLGSPEESIKVSRISRQSSARSTPLIGDYLCARISRSPSIGVLEHTLNPGREHRTENIHIKERTVGDSQGQEAASYRAKDAGSKAGCTESLRHGTLGAEDQNAGCTSALADDATREHSGSPQRPPENVFPSTSGEAQEVFGRGILRIQPHGPRNAYVITFLPDVVQPASMSSMSEMPCEKPSHSTGCGPANPANARVADGVPGGEKDLPIDPLILADDEPWEAGDLRQPFSLGDDPKPSETICPYPDPSPLFSSAIEQQDSVMLRQDKDAQFISSPHDCHSVAAGNPPSSNPPGPAHGGRQSKSRKRKPRRPDGQQPKRVRGPHTSTPEGNSFAALHTHFMSLLLDKRLQFLPWLLEGVLPHHMPRPDPLTTGNGDARPASRLTQRIQNTTSQGRVHLEHPTADDAHASHFVAVHRPSTRDHGRAEKQTTKVLETQPVVQKWDYDYPADGGLNQTLTTTSHDGLTTKKEVRYSLVTGQAIAHTDQSCVQDRFDYDKLGRVVKATTALGTPYEAALSQEYATLEDGQGASLTTSVRASNETFRVVQERSYNELGQCVKVVEIDWLRKKDAAPTEQRSVQTLEYDDWGEVCRTVNGDEMATISLYDPTELTRTEGIEGEGQSKAYLNLFGSTDKIELLTRKGKVESKVEYHYDGLSRLVAEVDALGRTTEYETDSFDRISKITWPGSRVVETRYAGHSASALPESVTVNGRTLGAQLYDGLDRVKEKTIGTRTTLQHYKNSSPEPHELISPRGTRADLEYEPSSGYALTHRIAVKGQGTAGSPNEDSYGYNARTGALSKLRSPYITVDLEYLASGLLWKETIQVADGPKFSTISTYTMAGKLQGYTDVHGHEYEAQYDADGRVDNLLQGSLKVGFTHNERGYVSEAEVKDEDRNSILTTRLWYDDFGRETDRAILHGTKTLFKLKPIYGPTGLVAERDLKDEDDKVLRHEGFEYDVHNRLVDYTCSGEESQLPVDEHGHTILGQKFEFDDFENLSKVITRFQDGSENVATYTPSETNPTQLDKITNTHKDFPADIDLEYDENGCLTRDEKGRTLEYDDMNRLIAVRDAGGKTVSEYLYDATGRLVCQRVPNEPDYHLFYCEDQLIAVKAGDRKMSYLSDGEVYWGQTVLHEEIIEDIRRAKHMFTHCDLTNIINSLWTDDDPKFIHPSFRVAMREHGKLRFNPVAFPLEMAFQDGAFRHIHSLDTLKRWNPNHNEPIPLLWASSVAEEPVLRTVTRFGGISKRPWTRECFCSLFRAVVINAGYPEIITIHTLRRGLANRLDKVATDAERSQVLTQKDPNVFGRSYIDSTSALSPMDVFLGEAMRLDHVEYLRGVGKYRAIGYPRHLPAQRQHAIQQNQDLQELGKRLQELHVQQKANDDDSDGYEDKDDDDSDAGDADADAKFAIRLTKKQVQVLKTRLHDAELAQYRKEWIESRVETQVKSGGKASEAIVFNDITRCLCKAQPERRHLAEMIPSEELLSYQEMLSAFDSEIQLRYHLSDIHGLHKAIWDEADDPSEKEDSAQADFSVNTGKKRRQGRVGQRDKKIQRVGNGQGECLQIIQWEYPNSPSHPTPLAPSAGDKGQSPHLANSNEAVTYFWDHHAENALEADAEAGTTSNTSCGSSISNGDRQPHWDGSIFCGSDSSTPLSLTASVSFEPSTAGTSPDLLPIDPQILQEANNPPVGAALLSFEDILTEEQKRQYHANTTKPDAASIIAFVADIDANNNSTNRRCVAPRLCTFLEATQQFSSVVDTFVSSNPTLAALIWGGVKMAILTASNVASYFDKVTSMIMGIGKSCPTYQKFGQLYPGCVGLQRALCDYYAIIVKLCIKIIEVSRRTAITQTLTAIFVPFESEFKSSLNEVDQAAKDIQLQISLASKQTLEEARKLLEHESQDNTAFRRLTSKFQKETEKEHAEAKQLRIIQMEREAAKLKSSIRDNLSSVNHVKPWKQAMQQRVPSTAEWLQQESLFHQWKDDRDTAILWCSGTMGVGKTVLMSNVVAQLHASRKTNDIISYYFCRADDAPTLSARSILGSLARQILDSQIENAEHESLRAIDKDSRDLDTAKVIDFLLSHLQVGKTYYLVLDGLDECDGGDIQMVARSLAQLCDKHVSDIKILCAGRPELEKELWRVITPKYRIQVTERKVESDMDHYITTILGRCLEEEQLKLGDPKLIMPISKALQEGSKGIAVSDCCGLTFINEEDNTVHYVHQSVKQHLFTIHSLHSPDFDMARIDQHLGFLCMTYLDFTDFKRQLMKVKEGSNIPIKPLQLGTFPISRSSNVTSRIALKLLSYRRQLQHLSAQELERKAQEVLGDLESSRLELEIQKRDFQFFNYAWTYWINHVADLDPDAENKMWRLFCRCVEGNDILACRPWESKQQNHGERSNIPKEIQWLVPHGHYSLLLYYAKHQSHILTENVKRQILCNTAIHDRYRFTELIIQQMNTSRETLNRGLLYASREGCNGSVTILLQAAAYVNARVCDRTALQAAAGGGHLEVVERLLAARADVNAPAADDYGRTALQAAAEGGHLEVVGRLKQAGAR
ncbi:uncharacterized protein CDV56_101052 [Aspergillus thermomutatus]|uniref:Uncharacterized protein n=1 Tax=Aspergillus thermomutatus TaxID=41047 RepID=A0A397HE59_ASPTH|nr:uncharacterized protein CDV56_101052 [Aspergillus thermomutatus]RHZ59573.1 hypothetical protein CDV56_101052 [Aspergillus thermomutatus]